MSYPFAQLGPIILGVTNTLKLTCNSWELIWHKSCFATHFHSLLCYTAINSFGILRVYACVMMLTNSELNADGTMLFSGASSQCQFSTEIFSY